MLKYDYRIEGGCVKNKIYYKSLFYVFLMVIYGILTYVFFWVGFNTKYIAYEAKEREHGESKWSFLIYSML